MSLAFYHPPTPAAPAAFLAPAGPAPRNPGLQNVAVADGGMFKEHPGAARPRRAAARSALESLRAAVAEEGPAVEGAGAGAAAAAAAAAAGAHVYPTGAEAAVNRKRERAPDHIDLLPPEQLSVADRRRKRNRASAAASRNRKNAELNKLRAESDALRAENAALRARLAALEGVSAAPPPAVVTFAAAPSPPQSPGLSSSPPPSSPELSAVDALLIDPEMLPTVAPLGAPLKAEELLIEPTEREFQQPSGVPGDVFDPEVIFPL